MWLFRASYYRAGWDGIWSFCFNSAKAQLPSFLILLLHHLLSYSQTLVYFGYLPQLINCHVIKLSAALQFAGLGFESPISGKPPHPIPVFNNNIYSGAGKKNKGGMWESWVLSFDFIS